MDDSLEVKSVGAAIRARRVAKGVSQEKFADQIQMHRAYYGAIERGAHNITITTLNRIAKGLGMPASEILGEAGL